MPTLARYLRVLPPVKTLISQQLCNIALNKYYHTTQYIRVYAPVLSFLVYDHRLQSWHEGTPCWPANDRRRDRVGFSRTWREIRPSYHQLRRRLLGPLRRHMKNNSIIQLNTIVATRLYHQNQPSLTFNEKSRAALAPTLPDVRVHAHSEFAVMTCTCRTGSVEISQPSDVTERK